MNQPALFALESAPPKRQKSRPHPRLGKQPTARTCPTCRLTVLAALNDGGLAEQTVDPWTLTLPAIRAAHLLNIPVYRAPVDRNGRPEELWWSHPDDPMSQWGKYAWLPAHQCGRPQLPGTPVPVSKPNPVEFSATPPY